MNKRDKADRISKILEELYPNPPIPLIHYDSYTLLVAVVLSAQCTDERVNQVTKNLFKRAKSPEEMLLMSPKEIESIIRACGLSWRKAQALWQLSKQIIERFDGEVPQNLEDLESLPGVGHKTAQVVLIQAFDKDAFPVDTHIHRLAKRWGLSRGKNVLETEKDLKEAFEQNLWKKLHLQIIYFGREYCPAKKHQKENCPICVWAGE